MIMLFKEDGAQTKAEEIANATTHLIGFGLSISALVIMTILATFQGSAYKIVGSVLFGTSLITLYAASTLYHAFMNPKVKAFFKVLDHTMIYFLIAGTYTPLTFVTLHGDWGWSLFGTIWGLAFLGLFYKLFYTGKQEILSVAIYITMGWLAIIAIKPLYQHLPHMGFMWLVLGGLSYTLGVIFYVFERMRFSHAIWHLFVLGGSLCHFFCILFYVIPGH